MTQLNLLDLGMSEFDRAYKESMEQIAKEADKRLKLADKNITGDAGSNHNGLRTQELRLRETQKSEPVYYMPCNVNI